MDEIVKDLKGNAYKRTGVVHTSANTRPNPRWTFAVVRVGAKDAIVLTPPFRAGISGQMFSKFEEVEPVAGLHDEAP